MEFQRSAARGTRMKRARIRGRSIAARKKWQVLPGRNPVIPAETARCKVRSKWADAAFYSGPRFGAKFIEGAPVFAVEVRSQEDYGPMAERRIAAKRADYFAA